MSLSASRARTVFRACVVNAVRDSEALMEALVTGTREALTAQESSTRDLHKRTQISDALRLLKQHEASLPKAYPMALLEIFAEGPSAAKTRAGQPGGMDLGELALMDDADVLVQVELSRAQQIAAVATEATLAELNTLVSSAQGLHSVQPESNPFRPENYIRALQQVVSDTGVSGEVRQLWMSQMRELLGTQLVSAYKRAGQSLREHGVEPVGYAVAGAPGVRSGHGGGYAHSSQMGVGYTPSAYGAPASEYGAASAYGQGYGAGWGGASGSVALAPKAEEGHPAPDAGRWWGPFRLRCTRRLCGSYPGQRVRHAGRGGSNGRHCAAGTHRGPSVGGGCGSGDGLERRFCTCAGGGIPHADGA